MKRRAPDEKALPRWAREKLAALRSALETERAELLRTRRAHALTDGRAEWFTVPGPPPDAADDETYKLFYLSRDGAHPACVLGKGDVLFVGRKVKP